MFRPPHHHATIVVIRLQWKKRVSIIMMSQGGERSRAMQSAREWSVTRSTRKMCVCPRPVRCPVSHRRVQGSCHCPDAKSRKKTTTSQQLGLHSCWIFFLKKKVKTAVRCWCRQLPTWCSKLGSTSSLVLGSTSWESESMLSYLTTFQNSYCLSIRVDPSPKSRRTWSIRMNLVSRKKRMTVGSVLLQNIQPN